jgi:hypothetical protein
MYSVSDAFVRESMESCNSAEPEKAIFDHVRVIADDIQQIEDLATNKENRVFYPSESSLVIQNVFCL